MFNIIPLILILLSLSVVIAIVIKKFPILASLDVENMQKEKEAKFKEKIISNRLKRSYYKYYSLLLKIFQPVMLGIKNSFSWFYKKLVDYRENYKKEQGQPADGDIRLNALFTEAEELFKQGKNEEAEKKYIDIISLDSKNINAFKYLGKIYYIRKDFHEARQTFEHALRLIEKDENNIPAGGDGNNKKTEYIQETKMQLEEIYYNLSLILIAVNNFSEALKNINKCLRLEENNPRYLDTKLEISIMKKDKFSAMEAYEKLEKSNPENNKLQEWKEKIAAL